MSESPKELIENDSSSLLEELTAAYKQCSTIRITAGGLLDALLSPDRKVSAEAATYLHVLDEKLTDLILKDSRFPGDRFLMMMGDGIDNKIYPNSIGNLLVRRTLQTGEPEEAIQWLQKVLKTEVAFGKRIHSLWGVRVASEFELTHNVKILPFEDVPDSEQKYWITSSPSVRSMMPLSSPRSYLRPTAALMMVRRIEPFIYDISNKSPYSKAVVKEMSNSKELLNDITLVLTVIGPRVAMSLGNWLTFDDEDLQQASTMCGCGWGWQRQEMLPDGFGEYPVLDPTEAQQIVKAFLALQSITKDKVRVALQRLSQSLRRHSVGDRAVELSIALETLLGDSGNSEMTHKIKVRLVRLIGGKDEVRKKNAAIITKAYSIRSALVHTGRVDAAASDTICGARVSVSDIIDQAILLCAHLIKKIILDGKIPDWSNFDLDIAEEVINVEDIVSL